MAHHDPNSIYDPNSPYYDDAPRYPQVTGGAVWGMIGLGAFAVAFFWSYVAPAYYTIAYIVEFLMHLSDPRVVVRWQGDSSTYTIVVAGLTGIALMGGMFWLFHRVWRFVRSLSQGY